MLVGVLKRSWTNKIFVYLFIYLLICCEELAHAVKETDKSQDLQLASWRPWRVNGVVPVPRFVDQRCRKSQCFSSSPKAEKIWCSSLKAVRQEEFPLTCGRISLLSLLRFSAERMGLTPIWGSDLLYSVYQFNCQSHPSRTLQTPE